MPLLLLWLPLLLFQTYKTAKLDKFKFSPSIPKPIYKQQTEEDVEFRYSPTNFQMHVLDNQLNIISSTFFIRKHVFKR